MFDVQGLSVHDGPGGRTLLFFKGCPLRCYWCSNPEGLNPYPEVVHRRSGCALCLRCAQSCPRGAIGGGPHLVIDREKCRNCEERACTDACITRSLGIAGRCYTLPELLSRVERDRRFWGPSGGVTLGGGEVMLQHPFAAAFLRECQESGIHTCIETSGYARWSDYEGVLEWVDWVFVDIKHMDPAEHEKATGVANGLILHNVGRMAERKTCRVIPRVPVIPGFNTGRDNVLETARFIRGVGLQEVNILPFHRLGTSKYENLGIEYSCKDMQPPSADTIDEVATTLRGANLKCYVGGDTPF